MHLHHNFRCFKYLLLRFCLHFINSQDVSHLLIAFRSWHLPVFTLWKNIDILVNWYNFWAWKRSVEQIKSFCVGDPISADVEIMSLFIVIQQSVCEKLFRSWATRLNFCNSNARVVGTSHITPVKMGFLHEDGYLLWASVFSFRLMTSILLFAPPALCLRHYFRIWSGSKLPLRTWNSLRMQRLLKSISRSLYSRGRCFSRQGHVYWMWSICWRRPVHWEHCGNVMKLCLSSFMAITRMIIYQDSGYWTRRSSICSCFFLTFHGSVIWRRSVITSRSERILMSWGGAGCRWWHGTCRKFMPRSDGGIA